MSWEKHEDDCPGCRPAMLDMKTGQVLPEDAPEMKAILGVWAETTPLQREAYHRVMCQNSRDEIDLGLLRQVQEKMQKALDGLK